MIVCVYCEGVALNGTVIAASHGLCGVYIK